MKDEASSHKEAFSKHKSATQDYAEAASKDEVTSLDEAYSQDEADS